MLTGKNENTIGEFTRFKQVIFRKIVNNDRVDILDIGEEEKDKSFYVALAIPKDLKKECDFFSNNTVYKIKESISTDNGDTLYLKIEIKNNIQYYFRNYLFNNFKGIDKEKHMHIKINRFKKRIAI